MTQSSNQTDSAEIPNGAAAAAMVATGAGCAALGFLNILVEASPTHFKNWLNLYNPVGPLSGVSCGAVAVYLITWFILASALRGKSVRLCRWTTIAFVLIFAGLVMTFPPVFGLFAAS